MPKPLYSETQIINDIEVRLDYYDGENIYKIIINNEEIGQISGNQSYTDVQKFINSKYSPAQQLDIRAKQALEKLPKPFQSYVSYECYCRGHNAGEEEVNNYILEMATDLFKVIEKCDFKQ